MISECDNLKTITIMDEKKQKRVLNNEPDETVVMKQELSEEELDQATGGAPFNCQEHSSTRLPPPKILPY